MKLDFQLGKFHEQKSTTKIKVNLNICLFCTYFKPSKLNIDSRLCV